MTARLPAVPQAALVVTALASVCLGVVAGVDPALAVAGALGLAFALVVLADLSLGVTLFALIAFLDAVPGLAGPAVSFSKAAGVLLAVSWLATASREGGRREFVGSHPGITYLLVLFVAWAALSQLWAENGAAALEATYRYALNLVLFLIVFAAVRQRRHPFWVIGAFVGGAVLSAVYGIVTRPSAGDDLDRIAGTLGDPNELASLLVAGAVLAAGLAAAARPSSPGRGLAVAASGICLIAVFLTLSRGGLVSLAVALAAAVVLMGRWRPRAGLVAVMTVLFTIAYFTIVAPDQAAERLTTADGGTGRTDIWEIGWRMVEDRPLAGIGAGNFEISSIHYLLVEPGALERDEFIVDDPKVAHNIYLQVLAELGVVGLALFGGILVTSFACAVRAARRFAERDDRSLEVLTRSVAVAIVAILAADFFISAQFTKQLWILLALGPAMLALAGSGGESQAARDAPG